MRNFSFFMACCISFFGTKKIIVLSSKNISQTFPCAHPGVQNDEQPETEKQIKSALNSIKLIEVGDCKSLKMTGIDTVQLSKTEMMPQNEK